MTRSWIAVFTLIVSVALSGCTLQTTATHPSTTTAFSGTVHGGSQPIVGAHVYMFAPSPTGYGGSGIAPSTTNASVPLLTQGDGSDALGNYVLTDANGGFHVDLDYDCTAKGTFASPGSENIYFYVLGGNTGSGSNPASGLLAAIGPCTAPYASKFTIDEITTVAAAYALAGFATDATHIGYSGSALGATGLNNPFLTSQNLATLASGTAATATVGGNGTPPTAAVTTLADILAACVNTSGSAASGSPCNTLFAYTQTSGATGTAPTDTATAAINLAHNPYPTAAGVTALFGLVPAIGTPYSGGLTAQPNDFTLALTFSGGGINFNTLGIAIDAQGNAWASSFALNPSSPNGRAGDITEFSPTGTPLSPSTGYASGLMIAPRGIAVDLTGNVWVVDFYNGVFQLSSAGVPSSFSPYALPLAQYIALDTTGNAWFSISGNSSVQLGGLSSTGLALPNSPYGGNLFGNGAGGVALDGSGNIWAGTATNDTGFVKYATAFTYNTGISATLIDASPSNGQNSFGTAVDATGNVWTANVTGFTISFLAAGSSTVTTFAGGGLSDPEGLAIDGAGNVWASNTGNGSVSQFTNAGTPVTPATGYTAGGSLRGSPAIAVDGSGNLWVTNNTGQVATTGISPHITEIIGAATPVITPIVGGLPTTPTVNGSSNMGTRP